MNATVATAFANIGEEETEQMEFHKIDATIRTQRGKGPTSRLRREGKIPAVAYGRGQDTKAISVNPKDLVDALKGPWGRNVVLEVSIDGTAPFPAIVADYDYHPLTRDLLHADFLCIDLNKPVDVEVPLHTVGKAVGVVEGGVLREIFRKLPITCLPANIPQFLEFDVTEMHLNDVRKVSDLKLPEGVTIRLPMEQTFVAVDAAATDDEAEAAEAAEGEAAAAPAEAADKDKEKDKEKK